MSPYKAVYGWDYPLLNTYKTKPSAVPVADDYYNWHQKVHNAAYQVLKMARFRSTKTAAKRRNPEPPVAVGAQIMVFGDQFATESGRSKKLQPHWRGPFTVLEYDSHTQNYTIKMDARMYRCKQGVFHCSVVKPFHPNDDAKFPGRAHTNPAPILINEQPEWQVEAILDHRAWFGRD